MASLRRSTGKRAALHGKAFLSDRATSPSTATESFTETEDEGGVRLDTLNLDALNLEDSPKGAIRPALKTHCDLETVDSSPAGGAPLFQVGNIAGDEDVFASPGKSAQTPNKAGQIDYPEDLMTTQSPGVQSGLHLSKKKSQTFEHPLNSSGFIDSPQRILRTRASDLSARHQVGGIDAQSFYPSSACVFVANLPENIKDGKLEAEVTRHFSRFGTVFVKIRRDHKNMPFAFCQYTKDEDARLAMAEGKGTVIHGRSCRTEMVKANRAFIMFHNHGGHLGVEEARKALAQFGPMSKCEPLDAQMQEALNLGPSVIVEFTTFDPSRDIQAAFRHHVSYRVMAYDPKKAFQSPKIDADEIWLQRYEVDRRSIFIGNLPSDEEELEEKIKEITEDIGDVVAVQVIRKEGKNGRPVVFSFVEFVRPDMAEMAVHRLSGQTLFGSNTRVERKSGHNTTPHQPRRARSTLLLSDAYQSPVRGGQSASVFSPSTKMPPENMPNISNAMADPTPMTPLKNVGDAAAQPSSARSAASSATPGAMAPPPYLMSYPGQHYGSPNYTTSPYNNHGPPASYVGNHPGAQQGIGAPQGMGASHGMVNAYPPQYFPAQFPLPHWAQAYMTDPSMMSMSYYQSPIQMAGPVVRSDEGVPETPTKQAPSGSAEDVSGQSGPAGL